MMISGFGRAICVGETLPPPGAALAPVVAVADSPRSISIACSKFPEHLFNASFAVAGSKPIDSKMSICLSMMSDVKMTRQQYLHRSAIDF
jgi:hypothetical protein